MSATTPWTPVYVGLGSNLDNPYRQLTTALEALAGLPDTRVVCCSEFVESAPLGPTDQPDFTNAVAGLLTKMEPVALLSALQAIEKQHGRTASDEKWGPRPLDLDVLVFGRRQISGPTLTVPHPCLHERPFVLRPFAEIAPHVAVPGRGATVLTLANRIDLSGLRPSRETPKQALRARA